MNTAHIFDFPLLARFSALHYPQCLFRFIHNRFNLGAASFFALLFGASLPFQVVAQTESYKLDTGDVIAISVYEEDDLTFNNLSIGDAGTITYPFIGVTQVSGKTTAQLETDIRTGLIEGEFLIDPKVTVNIVRYRPFFIDGAVNAPGGYPFQPGLTLRKAVSLAGGFTERASRSNITVHSQESSDAADSRKISSLEEPIRPGDIITVEQRFF